MIAYVLSSITHQILTQVTEDTAHKLVIVQSHVILRPPMDKCINHL